MQITSPKQGLDQAQLVLCMLLFAYLVPGNLLGVSFVAPALQGVILVSYVALNLGVKAPLGALLVGGGFGIAMMLLTVAALIIDFERSIARDYAELAKYGLIALAFLAGAIMAKVEDIDGKLATACLIGAFCFTALGLVESAQTGAGAIMKSLYGRNLPVLEGKPILSFWTTYFAASMYAFLASVLIARVATFRTSWLAHLAIGLLLLMILLTQSRSGFLALGVLAAAYFVALCVRRSYTLLATLILAAIIGGTLAALLWRDQLAARFAYLWYGLQNYLLGFMQNMDGENSLGYRVDQIQWALENNGNMLIGAGVGKSYQPYLESFLSLFYYRYGLVGIFLYLAIWGWPLVYLLSLLIRRKKLESTALVAVGIFSATLPCLSVSSVITDQIHFLFLYYLALGLWYGLALGGGRHDRASWSAVQQEKYIAH